MGIYTKVIAGGPGRRTRLHTEQNEMIPLSAAVALPIVVGQWLRTKISGARAEVPWWPLRVIPIIEQHLLPTSDVIEFGSGSSTVWLARRSGKVVSIEDNQEWHLRTSQRLEREGLKNAAVLYRDGASYYSLTGIKEGEKFDLAIIDGSWRWLCVQNVLPRMKPGGIVYLDNADADKDAHHYSRTSERRAAQSILEEFVASSPGASLLKVRSLINGELHAGEGWIVQMPQGGCLRR